MQRSEDVPRCLRNHRNGFKLVRGPADPTGPEPPHIRIEECDIKSVMAERGGLEVLPEVLVLPVIFGAYSLLIDGIIAYRLDVMSLESLELRIVVYERLIVLIGAFIHSEF